MNRTGAIIAVVFIVVIAVAGYMIYDTTSEESREPKATSIVFETPDYIEKYTASETGSTYSMLYLTLDKQPKSAYYLQDYQGGPVGLVYYKGILLGEATATSKHAEGKVDGAYQIRVCYNLNGIITYNHSDGTVYVPSLGCKVPRTDIYMVLQDSVPDSWKSHMTDDCKVAIH